MQRYGIILILSGLMLGGIALADNGGPDLGLSCGANYAHPFQT